MSTKRDKMTTEKQKYYTKTQNNFKRHKTTTETQVYHK